MLLVEAGSARGGGFLPPKVMCVVMMLLLPLTGLGSVAVCVLMKARTLAFCLLLLTIMILPASAADAPYRHVVFFKFKAEATADQVQGLEKAFGELAKKIDTVKEFEWGTNVSPEGLNDGFTHCFFVTFADKAGLDTYLPHAEHQAFVGKLKPLLDKVCVLDYIAKK